jgi:hypothetical protein
MRIVSDMWRVVVLVGVVAIALGVAAAGGFGSDAPPPAAEIARLAQVVCEPDAARVHTERVSALRDGVHVVVENDSRATSLEIRSPSDVLLDEVPLSSDAPTQATFALPPGPASVTCISEDDEDRATDAGVLTVVDAGNRWVSPDLPCDLATVERAEYVTDLVRDERPVATARRAVPGLRGSDELESPGYPGSTRHGDLIVVFREGQAVARIARADDNDAWHVFVEACPGSGLVEG